MKCCRRNAKGGKEGKEGEGRGKITIINVNAVVEMYLFGRLKAGNPGTNCLLSMYIQKAQASFLSLSSLRNISLPRRNKKKYGGRGGGDETAPNKKTLTV